jgi:hypothetical protein
MIGHLLVADEVITLSTVCDMECSRVVVFDSFGR